MFVLEDCKNVVKIVIKQTQEKEKGLVSKYPINTPHLVF